MLDRQAITTMLISAIQVLLLVQYETLISSVSWPRGDQIPTSPTHAHYVSNGKDQGRRSQEADLPS